MPAINNPSISFSSSFEDIIRATLVEFALEIKRNETPITAPNAGYKGYDKRMKLAGRLIANRNDEYLNGVIKTACQVVYDVQPDILMQENIFRILTVDNPSGRNVFCNEYLGFSNGWNGQVGENKQIFSLLADCSQQDFI